MPTAEKEPLTPVTFFRREGWWAKRGDLAGKHPRDPEGHPSGAKVRQFLLMASKHPPGTPMVVGCSAVSLMQVYLADAGERTGADAFVFVPHRATRSHATEWSLLTGAHVREVSPGYPSVYRKAAREYAERLGECIRWDGSLAVEDAAAQVENLPEGVRRVVVPTGSGLITTGVLVGLARRRRVNVGVLSVMPKGCMAREAKIIAAAEKVCYGVQLPTLTTLTARPYAKPHFATLPDGTELDPSYAAKCVEYLREGDCLWVTGTRPARLIRRQQRLGGE